MTDRDGVPLEPGMGCEVWLWPVGWVRASIKAIHPVSTNRHPLQPRETTAEVWHSGHETTGEYYSDEIRAFVEVR